jgi:3-oxoacyl-[acyl-carrier protein] reductase
MSQRPFHILGLQQIAITVNALLPGVTDTDMNAAWLHTPEAPKFAAEMSAFGRVGQTEDIADAAAFIASSDTAG